MSFHYLYIFASRSLRCILRSKAAGSVDQGVTDLLGMLALRFHLETEQSKHEQAPNHKKGTFLTRYRGGQYQEVRRKRPGISAKLDENRS
jgi:hypothetical protein